MKKHLLAGETLVYKANLHWIIFLKAALAGVAALVLLAGGNLLIPDFLSSRLSGSFLSFKYGGLDMIRLAGLGLLAIFALPMALPPLIRRTTSEFWVSNKRVLIKQGLIRRKSFEIMLKKLEAIAVDQSILGRLLNYGSIGIVGTGSSKEVFELIQNPMEFRRRIQEQLDLM